MPKKTKAPTAADLKREEEQKKYLAMMPPELQKQAKAVSAAMADMGAVDKWTPGSGPGRIRNGADVRTTTERP